MNTYLSAEMDYLKGNAGPVSISDALSTAGSITSGSYIVSTNNTVSGAVVFAGPTNLSATTGDLSANRGGTGYVFLGATNRWINYDGTNYNLPGTNLLVNGQPSVRGATGAQTLIDAGNVNSGSIANGTTVNAGVTFDKAFTSTPTVVISLQTISGALNQTHLVSVTASSITTSGFTAGFNNQSGGTQTIFASWIALGQG